MFGRTTLAGLGAAAAVVVLAPQAQAASVSYTSSGFSQRVVLMQQGEELTLTNATATAKTFVSTSPNLRETQVMIRPNESFTYRFEGLPGAFQITVVGDVTTSPTLTVVVRP